MARGGERREPVRARVTRAERLELESRGRLEEINLSETIRRTAAFGLAYMPAGWSPEAEPLAASCEHCHDDLVWDGAWRAREDGNPGCPVSVTGHVPDEEEP